MTQMEEEVGCEEGGREPETGGTFFEAIVERLL